MSMMRSKLMVIWLATISVAVGVVVVRDTEVAQGAPALSGKVTIDELDVHRINVIEPDGKPRVILTSAARIPGAILNGKDYPHPGRKVGGGLLFFNDEGTEAGGLVYRTKTDGQTTDNQAIFTMDQHNQNELMTMNYGNEGGKRSAGLTVYGDYPENGLVPVIEAYAQVKLAKDPAAQQQAQQRMDAAVKVGVGRERTRMFIGREGDDAMLVLGDKDGKPRIVLKVDGQGEPSFELLDAAGKVVKRITSP